MEPYVIGLDLGTGSAKALAITNDGSIADTAQVAYPTLQPRPGHHEQDPARVEEAFVQCIAAITRSMQHPPTAIALSSAMHSLIPLSEDNEVLSPAMLWADNRSADLASELHASSIARQLYEETGTPIHPMSPLCKLLWLRKHDNDTFRRAKTFISLKEYIWHRLFGEFEVDYSIASATGLLNIEKRQWSDHALSVAGIHSGQLSTPVRPSHSRVCTEEARLKEMGLNQSVPFFIGASDGCLATLGSFANQPGQVSLTIGTSSAVRVMRHKPVLNFGAMIFNYLLDENTFVCGGPSNNGGVALRWYAETMRGLKLQTINNYQTLLSELDKSVPGANGLTFLPYILGERAPIWNSEATGAFFGLRAYHRPADLTRAVVEGISTALYDIADHMIDAGLDITEVHVSGGFIHSSAWLQLLADLFGKHISLVTTADASAYGAGMLALKEIGVINQYDDLTPKTLQSYFPNPNHMSAYRELFLRYRDLYKSTHHLMSQ